MNSFFSRPWRAAILSLFILTVVVVGTLASRVVSAAPPYAVTYNGAAVKQAVPGTPVTIKMKVTNTGSTVYSGVQVRIHVPEGITHSKVGPTDASVVDNTITWSNVPIAAGKSFYPEVTVAFDSGTAIGEKKNVWVEVTGDGMESNSQNFSLTAVSSVAASTSSSASTVSGSSLIPKINSIHRAVYGRNPTLSEHTYWLGRVESGEKSSYVALLGAMQWHKLFNIAH